MKQTQALPLLLRGYWRDVREYRDGTRVVGPWNKNQIQQSAATLVALLLARFGEVDSDYTGVSYFAVGSGLTGWDAVPPAKSTSATTLQTESFRKAMAVGAFAFVDPETLEDEEGPTVISTPSRVIRARCTLGYAEGNGTLREFALFGGNATASADSGVMFNWISHTAIPKTSDFMLHRDITIVVATGV